MTLCIVALVLKVILAYDTVECCNGYERHSGLWRCAVLYWLWTLGLWHCALLHWLWTPFWLITLCSIALVMNAILAYNTVQYCTGSERRSSLLHCAVLHWFWTPFWLMTLYSFALVMNAILVYNTVHCCWFVRSPKTSLLEYNLMAIGRYETSVRTYYHAQCQIQKST